MPVMPYTPENVASLGKKSAPFIGTHRYTQYYIYTTATHYFFVVNNKLHYYPYGETPFGTVMGHAKRAIMRMH